MYLSKRVRRQLVVFSAVAIVGGGTMAFGYLDLPQKLFGIGQYKVTVNLPASGGLYTDGNVTYRGVEVGRVDDVRLSSTGVDAVLSLKSGTKIPADLDANVHSQTAVGEQFIELVPRSSNGPMLKNGDVIPVSRTTLPPDVNTLLRDTNTGLQAIPHDDLKTVVDESYVALGGLGPDLARIVKGTTTLAADARNNLDALITVVDKSKPILDSQTDTSDAIHTWAANVAAITGQLHDQDPALKGVLDKGPAAVTEARALIDRLQPTLPVALANLVSLEQVAVTYQPALEQLLVLVPPDVEMLQGAQLANRDTKQAYKGLYLSFNLNMNLPPPCSTGYLPPQQVRPPSEVDYPERPAGDMYCRVPQDSDLDVRGARNLPCITRPGKRAPTVKMCESDENYVPLNDGYNWKGDPNATLSGQSVPQMPPLAPPPAGSAPPPPIAVTQYDPATGSYVGPDGKQYTQSNLAQGGEPRKWQDLLVPAGGS
ncbi:MCE family protein [Mycolicibacterium moriokaense]|uniref:Phospholipid/cholesterol/gamma-HCH transport system substrate-binding protein n=1 Tax=Mycolicibacterium moriokaense TaxID=39691 RepID=A0A318H6T3_9MYCO|nr:MlaD family protein [Mycolicibacterium moriokaense]PXX00334.1 phospholipid/cholesterol/gamma-HCH transport system substrate-binding protein [Mycolicibacterium moriokaense]